MTAAHDHTFGGEVNPGEKREFGKAMVHRVESEEGAAGAEALLGGLEEEFQVSCSMVW